jgi:hypothetical protein
MTVHVQNTVGTLPGRPARLRRVNGQGGLHAATIHNPARDHELIKLRGALTKMMSVCPKLNRITETVIARILSQGERKQVRAVVQTKLLCVNSRNSWIIQVAFSWDKFVLVLAPGFRVCGVFRG